MKKITVRDLARIIEEGLRDGTLREEAEVVVGFDSGMAATATDAGPNPVGELYVDTNA